MTCLRRPMPAFQRRGRGRGPRAGRGDLLKDGFGSTDAGQDGRASRSTGRGALTATIAVMATANVTVSLDPSVIEMAKDQAKAAGISMSAWVARTIRVATIAEAARRYEQFNRQADDSGAIGAWDDAQQAEQRDRLAGTEW